MRKLLCYVVLFLIALSLLRISLSPSEPVSFYTFITEVSNFSYDWSYMISIFKDFAYSAQKLSDTFTSCGADVGPLEFLGNLSVVVLSPLGLLLAFLFDLIGFIIEIFKVIGVILNLA